MNIYKSYQNILIDYGLRMTHELLHCLTSIPFRKKIIKYIIKKIHGHSAHSPRFYFYFLILFLI
jgi:hypothetical protein